MTQIHLPVGYEIQNIFARYTKERAVAFIYSLFARLEGGEVMAPEDVGSICLEVLADPRLPLTIALAETMPVPMGDVQEFLTRQEIEPQVNLENELPGLFAKLNHPPETRRTLSYSIESQLSACLIPREQYRLATQVLKYFPFWEAILCSNLPVVRRAAICRIPVMGSLFSALLSYFVDDPSDEVKAAVWKMLDIKVQKRNNNAWRGNIAHVDQLRPVIAKLPIDSDELELYLTDFRPLVRQIAATRLSPDSPYWTILARDASARVRSTVATRAALDHPAMQAIAGYIPCRNIIAGRRLELFKKKLKVKDKKYESGNEQTRQDNGDSGILVTSN